MVDRRYFAAVGIAVSLCLLLSASVGLTAGEPDPDELIERAVDSLENQPVEAVHTQEITRPDGEVTQTVAIHKQSPHYSYLEILESTDERAGQQMMFNDSTVWRENVDSGSTVQYKGLTRFWFDEARTLGATPAEVKNHYEGKYEGVSEVGNREAHVVALNPPREVEAGLSLDIGAENIEYDVSLYEASREQWYLSQETWWIDSETHYPIKQTVEWTDESGKVIATATRTYEELRLGSKTADGEDESDTSITETVIESGDADVAILSRSDTTDADSRHEERGLESQRDEVEAEREPETVRTTESDLYEPTVFQTRHATNAFVPFDLPDVDVPADYVFDRATVQDRHGGYNVMLLYEEVETGATLSVQLSNGPFSVFEQIGESIHEEELDGFDGKIAVTDSGTAVIRQCDDLTFWVRGPPAAETLIEVTKSLEC